MSPGGIRFVKSLPSDAVAIPLFLAVIDRRQTKTQPSYSSFSEANVTGKQSGMGRSPQWEKS